MIDTSTSFAGSSIPERTILSEGFEISRIVTGLWQVADMEKSGTDLETDIAARAMLDYVQMVSIHSIWRIIMVVQN